MNAIRRRLLSLQAAIGGGPDYSVTFSPDAKATNAATLDIEADWSDPGTLYILQRQELSRTPQLLLIVVKADGTKYSAYTYNFGGTSFSRRENYTLAGASWKANGICGPWDASYRGYLSETWDVYKLKLEE